jgi:type VI secretion system protein ImpH
MGVADEDLLFYTGLLGMQQRNAASLQRMVEDYFGVPAEVIQFVGGWYRLAPGSLCVLDDEPDELAAGLGDHTVVGDEIWDPQARVRLRIGPLPRQRYDEFLPGGEAHKALAAFTDFFGRGELDFEVQLVLAREDVPPVLLGGEGGEMTPLGWCTWMRTRPFTRDADETTLTL